MGKTTLALLAQSGCSLAIRRFSKPKWTSPWTAHFGYPPSNWRLDRMISQSSPGFSYSENLPRFSMKSPLCPCPSQPASELLLYTDTGRKNGEHLLRTPANLITTALKVECLSFYLSVNLCWWKQEDKDFKFPFQQHNCCVDISLQLLHSLYFNLICQGSCKNCEQKRIHYA